MSHYNNKSTPFNSNPLAVSSRNIDYNRNLHSFIIRNLDIVSCKTFELNHVRGIPYHLALLAIFIFESWNSFEVIAEIITSDHSYFRVNTFSHLELVEM